MMRTSGRVLSCCVALFLALTSVSAVKRLNSIRDLKKVNFGQSVPEHSLLLLHWFANIVEINSNNVIELTFDPLNEDYGSHHFGNYEGLLDPLPHGHQYYTLGNLNRDASGQLPNYVVHPSPEYAGTDSGRIIFRVRESRRVSQRIDRVFITQHYEASELRGIYDPAHTYEITTNLLLQIREFSVGQSQSSLTRLRNRFGSNIDDIYLQDIINTWGNLACLGLLLATVIKKKYSHQHNNRPKHETKKNTQPDFVVSIPGNSQNHEGVDCFTICAVISVIIFFLLYVISYSLNK